MMGRGTGGYGGGGPRSGGGQSGPRVGGGFDRPAWEMPAIDVDKIGNVIRNDDPELLVTLANDHGKHLAEAKLATSQIRGIFGAVRAMESRWASLKDGDERTADIRAGRRALLLLKPKLAYQAVRHRPTRPTDPQPVALLKALLEPAIGAVGDDPERFRRFLEFFEALLAYHKHWGGRD